MTEADYCSSLQEIRARIAGGTAEDLRRAEDGLAKLRSVYPKRLSYIAAEVALMLAKGAAPEDCRRVIDYAVQEFCPQEGLDDLLALKAQTYSEGTPERRQLDFLTAFYATGAFPQCELTALAEMKAELRAGTMDLNGLYELAVQYYVTRNTVISLVLMTAWCCLSGHGTEVERHVLWDAGQPCEHPGYSGNHGFLVRMLTDGESYSFLLTAGADDDDMPVLAMALRLLGHKVILLRESDEIHTANDTDTYAQRCVQEAEAVGGEIHIIVGKCRMLTGDAVDAVPAVVRLLTRSIEQEAPLILFASNARMSQLHERTSLGGAIQRLSPCMPSQFSYAWAFAWTGSYLSYVSYLYGESVQDLLSAPPTCDFSIVIPVRNAAETLRHTLTTCLAIDYEGSYEIVLSDNSDADFAAVRELCEEFADPRIRYYKTPLPLALDKSFEFAYLHARGAFILSIGADDGVCPWALNYLRQALTDHPNEEIFSWEKEFYTWPDFTPYEHGIVGIDLYDAQQPERYVRHALAVNVREIVQQIEQVFYALPLLYINAGFRRSYLTSVLERTGRLLDGASQDSYMGAVNLLLNDYVVHILCPLTVAGMSGASTGANTVLQNENLIAEAQICVKPHSLHTNYGEYVMRDRELRVPHLDTADKVGFHMSLVRLAELNVTDFEADAEAVLDYCARYTFLTDAAFERSYGILLHAASLCGERLYRTYRKRYEQLCANPEHLERPVQAFVTVDKRGYTAENHTLTLDAERFGCRNIADAVELTARLLNL